MSLWPIPNWCRRCRPQRDPTSLVERRRRAGDRAVKAPLLHVPVEVVEVFEEPPLAQSIRVFRHRRVRVVDGLQPRQEMQHQRLRDAVQPPDFAVGDLAPADLRMLRHGGYEVLHPLRHSKVLLPILLVSVPVVYLRLRYVHELQVFGKPRRFRRHGPRREKVYHPLVFEQISRDGERHLVSRQDPAQPAAIPPATR